MILKENLMKELEKSESEMSVPYFTITERRLSMNKLSEEEKDYFAFGPLVVRTGYHTGRSPNDKFIVRESSKVKKMFGGEK